MSSPTPPRTTSLKSGISLNGITFSSENGSVELSSSTPPIPSPPSKPSSSTSSTTPPPPHTLSPSYPYPVGDVTCWRGTRGLRSFCGLTGNWLVVNKDQILSGLTVALAQVPEAVSFSFVAGVSPGVGLQSAWIMGICTSLFGGRPGMVAGSTGAVAIVLPTLVSDYGIGHMFYAIILAGLLQITFGLLRLGSIVRLIPHPVMVGFCNGLGVVIGVAQFNIFKQPNRDEAAGEGGGRRRLMEIGGAFSPFTNGEPWIEWDMALWMCLHIVLALVTYAFYPRVVGWIPRRGVWGWLRGVLSVPASLAAIVVTTVVEHAVIRPCGFETNTVSDLASVAGSFPIPVWIDSREGTDYADLMPTLDFQLFKTVLPYSITVAAIGLLESLLTLEIIDELTSTKGNGSREAIGQGLGQLMSGILGGMGGCTTIGQSLMNIHSGGYTRLSSSVAACFMLVIILAAYPAINAIPVAGLAGVMFVVTYFTIEWESFVVVMGSCLPLRYRRKWKMESKVKRTDVLIMLVVVTVTLLLDLAIAVACGIVLSCLVFAWDSGTRLTFQRSVSQDGEEVVYEVGGPIFFGSVKPFLDSFPDPRNEPRKVTVLLHNADIHDWSGMMAIKRLHERFVAVNRDLEEGEMVEVRFEKLRVSSGRLMAKGRELWEGVNIVEGEELRVVEDPGVEGTHYERRDLKD